MSQLRDLLSWQIIAILESGQTQNSVKELVGMATSVISKVWNRLKQTMNVLRRPE